MPKGQAVILVGGKGTRLGDLTLNTPKPLLPIDEDRVFLDEVLFNVARHGVEDIILLAGHMGDQFASRYDGRSFCGADIRVWVEPKPAGTAGALLGVADWLVPEFLFLNGDSLFDFNLLDLHAVLARSAEAWAALALRRVPDASRFGSVEVDAERIVGFREKSAASSGAAGCVNGGVGWFRREILGAIAQSPCSIEADVYPRLASAGRLYGREYQGYFLDIGLPETFRQGQDEIPRRRKRPTVFLDRDGVLNHDAGYTYRTEQLKWIDGAQRTVKRVNDIGALAIVVTNQSGVARGLYSLDDVDNFHAAMQAQLAQHGAHIDAFYVSPDHPDAIIPELQHPDPPDRKPNPGMLLRAMSEWPVDPARSLLIGDKESDLEAARRAGVLALLFAGGDLEQASANAIDQLGRDHS